MTFEVMISVAPPEHHVWPPPEDVFTAWSASLNSLVESIGGSRTMNVYGPGYVDAQGNPAPQAHVLIWTDGYPETWTDALNYVGQRVQVLESAGYDVSGVEVTPGRHLILVG